jgi:hypothetical protein
MAESHDMQNHTFLRDLLRRNHMEYMIMPNEYDENTYFDGFTNIEEVKYPNAPRALKKSCEYEII